MDVGGCEGLRRSSCHRNATGEPLSLTVTAQLACGVVRKTDRQTKRQRDLGRETLKTEGLRNTHRTQKMEYQD